MIINKIDFQKYYYLGIRNSFGDYVFEILSYNMSFDYMVSLISDKKEGGYTIKPKETITVEKHLNGDIKISKNGVYIEHRVSHNRPERAFKLLTAPISRSNLDLMKQDIIEIERKDKILKEKQKENNKTDTYYQKHGKCSPYIANCFN